MDVTDQTYLCEIELLIISTILMLFSSVPHALDRRQGYAMDGLPDQMLQNRFIPNRKL